MSNPLDEYLAVREEGIEKTAFFRGLGAGAMGAMRGLGRGITGATRSEVLGGELARIGIHAGILAAGTAAAKAYSAITKGRDFKRMLDANPDLQDAHADSTDGSFSQQYSSFRSMNPEFAADPVVAGTYMRQMNMNPMGAGKTIVEAMGARRGLPQSPVQFKQIDLPRLKEPPKRDRT